MTQQNILRLAKQGNSKAIAVLINRYLQPKGITVVKVALKDSCLLILLESAQEPNRQVVAFIRRVIMNLGSESIKKVKVYGKQTGENFPAWTKEFELVARIEPILTPTKSTTNIQKTLQIKKSQLDNLPTKKSILNNIIFTQDRIKNRIKNISQTQILLGLLLLLATLFFGLESISNKNYLKADCQNFKTIILAVQIADNDAVAYVNKQNFQGAASRIDKLAQQIKNTSLKDKKLNEIKEKLIFAEKTLSYSLRVYLNVKQYAVGAKKTYKFNNINADNINTKTMLAAENLQQASSNQISLINDANNYCKD